jgi:chromosome segregation ATPase
LWRTFLPLLSEKTQPLPFSVPEGEPERPPRRGAPLGTVLFVLFWMLAGLALVATLCVFWFRELDRRKDAERKAAAAQSEVGTATARAEGLEEEIALVEDKLAAAQKELKPWRLRTAQRGDALRSTRGVLKLVAPLRESYGDVGETLAEIDSDAAAVSAAASSLQREVAALNAYLSRTEAADLSKRELREHGNTLRARAAAVGTARRAFVDARGGYGDAVEIVDARFEALSRAVAALRTEIAKALRR